MRMSRIIGGALLVTCALLRHAGASTSTPTTFPVGSLIIPTGASFQDDCGSVSAYGLVYDVLRAETWLAANGHGTITINYVVSSSKASPNRCKPTNLNATPTPTAVWGAGAPALMNDGCDFQLTGTGTAPPVTLVSNTGGADTTISTISTTGNSNVFPTYASVSVSASATTVGYLGGPFVISNAGTDASTFLSLLKGSANGGFDAQDAAGNTIDFSPFRSTATCNLGSTHHVNIHRSAVLFNAPVRKAFASQPPRLAVLATDTSPFYEPNGPNACPSDSSLCGVITAADSVAIAASSGATESAFVATYTTTSAHGLSVGDTVVVSGVTKSGYNGRFTVLAVLSSTKFTVTLPVSGLTASGNGTATQNGSILENYLANAGLDFQAAQGCPTGGQNAANTTICPNGGAAGQVFDIFDFKDLVNSSSSGHTGLFTQDLGVNRYTMLWAPHWVTAAPTSSGPTATEATALANIATFLNGATGLLAECASISSFEGAYTSGSKDIYTGGLQLQTCVNNSGSCATGTTNWGVDRNPSNEGTGVLHNCSDGSGAGTNCVEFPTPTDEFVQIADYLWNTDTGHVVGYNPLPATSSIFKPGVTPLIQTFHSGTAVGYYASRNIKDNTPGKANIMYLGGHDQTSNVAGTKVALQTLLLLGVTTLPPTTTTTETSRNSPIVATVGSPQQTAVVVGSYNNVQPAPTAPVVNASADFTGWTFPFVTGHLRATVASTISTTSTQIGSGGTVLFDAAVGIPTPVPTGCGTNFSGTCRTIFTTTATPSTTTGIALHPANVYITEANAGTIGPLMTVGTTLALADWTKFMDRLLAGWWNGSAYVPALGGIDRSTVAVIGASAIANSTRPTIAYVGASDGMLHAICATVDSTVPTPICSAVGTELWAFLPRSQLPWVRLNKAKIDGSPRVVDAFGDFAGTGTRSFRTILTFQTGSGDPTSATAAQPAVYALDITNPQAPTVVWEYTIANPGALRGADTLGVGLTLAAGPISLSGSSRNLLVAVTNDGGTNGAADATAGIVVNGLDMETGSPIWSSPFVYGYPDPTRSSGALVPHTGVPGGAVGVDKQGQGFFTNIVFGDLYGDVWELDATTGLSSYPTKKPLFSFSTDFHPIGSPPAIYSNGSQDFAVIVSGGYTDLADTPGWGSGHAQSVVAMALAAPAADVTFSESAGSADVPFKFALQAGDSGFAQATIVGGQLFVTADSTDVNASGFGTTGAATGHVYTSSLSSTATFVSIQGGASSIANSGTTLYAASSNQQQQLTTGATSTVGATVDTFAHAQLHRMLWLRTE